MKDNKWKQEVDGEVIVQTTAWSPPGCHPVGCGVLLHVKDGKLVKVEGDPSHPITQGRLCVRCLALTEYVYHEDRVLYPMKRDPADRGKDAWERITWDEAIDMYVSKVNEIKQNYGAECIMVLGGTGREPTQWEAPLAYSAIGTPNQCYTLAGEACYGPRGCAAHMIFGAGYPEIDHAQFFEDRYDDPRFTVPQYVIIWGKDPLWSNPDGFFGHAIIDLMKRGTKLITVDPRVTWLGSRAEYVLQLRPGTDAALGLGMINVIIEEDLYDHEFVENWCFGFDELAERVREYPPEKVEEITWVPKETLIAATRAFATNGPGSISWGLALDQNTNGMQASQCVLDILALCGYIDVPGGEIVMATGISESNKDTLADGNFAWRNEAYSELTQELKDKRLVADDTYFGYNNCCTHSHPDVFLDAIESGEPYQLRMLYFMATNPLPNQGVQPKRWHDAFLKMDFNVAQDVFMTPTAMACCDLFLPVSTYAEHDGLVIPEYGLNTNIISTINKAIEVGESKSDLEIMLMIGRRLNPEKFPWTDVKQVYDEKFGYGAGMETFDDLRNSGAQLQPYEYEKYKRGLMRPDGQPGFDTTTGLFEFNTVLFSHWGDDGTPYFEEPLLSPVSRPDLAEEYPLILTTGGREVTSFHSEHRQIPSLRQITPWPYVQINPQTAREHAIEEGDWVCLENLLGKCVYKAQITPTIDPRVVHASHGWWFPEEDGEEPNLYGVWKSSINSLIPRQAGRLGWGAPYKNVVCKIYRVEGHDCLGADDVLLMRDNDLRGKR